MRSRLDRAIAFMLGTLLLAMILVPVYYLFISVILFEPRTTP